jgi:hypothetical protein
LSAPLLSDAVVLAASEVCWSCGRQPPTEVRGGLPICDACLALPPGSFVCSCGTVHESREGLPVVGWMSLGDGTATLLVNCRCGSTISSEVRPIEQTPIAHERAEELAEEAARIKTSGGQIPWSSARSGASGSPRAVPLSSRRPDARKRPAPSLSTEPS